jgi:hypothetical protein
MPSAFAVAFLWVFMKSRKGYYQRNGEATFALPESSKRSVMIEKNCQRNRF